MIKFFEKIRKWLKELDTYDRVYWDGKLSSLLVCVLSAICIILIIILCLL